MSTEAEIKQFIDRVLRLKEEQDTLGEDIREVYAEAKGRGYDKTVLGNVVSHLRKLDKVGRDAINEREAIFDLYLTAYETGGRAHAPARTRESIEEFPVDAKLAATVANAVQTKPGRKALIAAVDIMIEREEQIDPDAGEITSPPETATEQRVNVPSQHEGHKAQATVRNEGVTVVGTESGTVINSETTPDPRPLTAADGQPRIPSSSPGCVKNDRSPPVVGQGCESSGIYTGSKEEQAVNNFEPPAFLQSKPLKTARDYRPHCQKPDACGASGLQHCYSCSKLIPEKSEVA